MIAARRRAVIVNARGLHARASRLFVETAREHDARVLVSRDGETVDGDSIMDLMMLAAGPGAELLIAAEGPDAQDAVDALAALVEAGFHEAE